MLGFSKNRTEYIIRQIFTNSWLNCKRSKVIPKPKKKKKIAGPTDHRFSNLHLFCFSVFLSLCNL